MKKKRNKKYNPNKHKLNPNSAYDAIRHSQSLPEEAKSKLLFQVHAAIEAFSKGAADTYHFDVLASTVDLCELIRVNLCHGIYNDEVHAARLGMLRCKERYKAINRMGMDGEALSAVKTLAIIHADMLDVVTGHEVLQFMEKRTNNIRGGNFFKGTATELEKMAA